MNQYHLSGGTIAALIGFCAARYGFSISDQEASMLGAAAFSLGAFVAHIFTGPGLFPAVRRALKGAPPQA